MITYQKGEKRNDACKHTKGNAIQTAIAKFYKNDGTQAFFMVRDVNPEMKFIIAPDQ